MDPEQDLKQRIVDTALALAEPRSWEVVRLHEVAEAAGITLDELRVYFREKEDIVEAWFDRADAAMLHAATAPGFLSLTTRRRLQRVIMAWLNALAPHRRVTRQMISGKLEPGHLHIQIPGIMRVSRTVQWFREAAHRDAAYVQRAFEEVATTGIYLTTFCYWMWDDSRGSGATEALLERLLGIAERFAHATVGPSAAVPGSGLEPPA
ncbi:MAG: TetR/AcrR family transcriptional regulator [Chromatiales bacterium]